MAAVFTKRQSRNRGSDKGRYKTFTPVMVRASYSGKGLGSGTGCEYQPRTLYPKCRSNYSTGLNEDLLCKGQH